MTTPKDLIEVVDLVIDAVMDVKASVDDDGSFSLADIPKFMNLLPEVIPAVDGIANIPSEFKKMDATDGAQLLQHVLGRITVTNQKAVSIIDAALKLAFAAKHLVDAIEAPAPALSEAQKADQLRATFAPSPAAVKAAAEKAAADAAALKAKSDADAKAKADADAAAKAKP